MNMNWTDLGHVIQTQGLKLLSGLLVLLIGFLIVHWILKISGRYIKKIKVEPTLETFLNNVIRLVLYLIVILTAANVMGIPLTSIITLIGTAGVAVSLGLQGALSNLVGGVMLLLLKPIKVGEYVKINDAESNIEGTVDAIGAFYTELIMPDNRRLSIPNSSLTNTPIVNFSREGTRRQDINYAVSYTADTETVLSVLRDLANSDSRILRDPAPVVYLSEYGDSALVFLLRIWCSSNDYWDVRYDLMKNGKQALDKAGIEIPYPQMDVHIVSDK
ncbi:MAG: mechanosensitive ion channel family protein [Anaerolineaceae bacterium]|nr:mechanosensitive ion channel family protein [Anaerolineaceae bacterium]